MPSLWIASVPKDSQRRCWASHEAHLPQAVGNAARREVDEVDGLTTIEEFAELTGYVMPEGPYDTVAGFFMAESGQVPALGSTTTFSLQPEENPEGPHARFTLEVSAVDGRRASWFALRREPILEGEDDA